MSPYEAAWHRSRFLPPRLAIVNGPFHRRFVIALGASAPGPESFETPASKESLRLIGGHASAGKLPAARRTQRTVATGPALLHRQRRTTGAVGSTVNMADLRENASLLSLTIAAIYARRLVSRTRQPVYETTATPDRGNPR